MFTDPYDDIHIKFCESLYMELFDDITKNKIYDFYQECGHYCYLPRYINENKGNKLHYIIKLNNAYWYVEIISSSLFNPTVIIKHLCEHDFDGP